MKRTKFFKNFGQLINAPELEPRAQRWRIVAHCNSRDKGVFRYSSSAACDSLPGKDRDNFILTLVKQINRECTASFSSHKMQKERGLLFLLGDCEHTSLRDRNTCQGIASR